MACKTLFSIIAWWSLKISQLTTPCTSCCICSRIACAAHIYCEGGRGGLFRRPWCNTSRRWCCCRGHMLCASVLEPMAGWRLCSPGPPQLSTCMAKATNSFNVSIWPLIMMLVSYGCFLLTLSACVPVSELQHQSLLRAHKCTSSPCSRRPGTSGTQEFLSSTPCLSYICSCAFRPLTVCKPGWCRFCCSGFARRVSNSFHLLASPAHPPLPPESLWF